jgi:hypothetical protein
MLCPHFGLTVWLENDELQYVLYGRKFTRRILLESIVAASGGKAVGLATTWQNEYLVDIIEVIEVVAEMNRDKSGDMDW